MEESQWQDLEEDLANSRKQHVELVNQHGMLANEAKVRHDDNFIRSLPDVAGDSHKISAYLTVRF